MKFKRKMNTNKSILQSYLKKSLSLFSLLLICNLLIKCTNPDDDDPKPNIDLEAEEIMFSVVKTDDYNGMATIKGTIKNIGDDFASGEGQQIIYLYERSLGTPTSQLGTEVARKAFTSLAAGETLDVSFSRNWNSASPAEGEFPPEYILVIGYDPDLYIDGNLNNDDTHHDNDKIMVSGSGINALF